MQDAPHAAHKALQSYLRHFRVAMYAAVGLLVVVFTIMALVIASTASDGNVLVQGAVVGAGLLAALGVYRLGVRPMLRRLERALTLTQGRGRRMRMWVSGLFDYKGLLVMLWDLDTDQRSRPEIMAVVRGANRRRRLAKGMHEATVYAPLSSPGQPVVVTSGTAVFWGTLVNKQMAAEGWNAVRRVFLGMLICSVVILGAVYWLGATLIEEAQEDVRMARESTEWPRIRAVIEESSVNETIIRDGKLELQGWEAVITYTYTVEGNAYSGDRIHIGYAPQESRASAQALVARFPEGATVEVAYDPVRPEMAVLEPDHEEDALRFMAEAEGFWWYLGVFGFVIFLFPLALLLYYSRKRRKVLDSV